MMEKNLFEILKIISKTKLDSQEKVLLISYLKSENCDIERLFQIIILHKLEYIFYKHLYDSKILFGCIPSIYTTILSEQFLYLQLKFQEYKEELQTIIASLKDKNVNYVLIKAGSLIAPLYTFNELIYRGFGDIDILISKASVDQIHTILLENDYVQGYVDEAYEIQEVSRNEKIYWSLNSHQEHKYIKKSRYFKYSPRFYLNFDVNTSIFEGGKYKDRISTDYLLNSTTIQNIEGIGETKILNHEPELLQLCYHFYKDTKYDIKKETHDDYCLRKFCDIREYILKFGTEIDWNLFTAQISKWNLEREVYYVLFLVLSFYKDSELEKNLKIIPMEKLNFNIPDWEKILLSNTK